MDPMNPMFGSEGHLALVKKYNRQIGSVLVVAVVLMLATLSYVLWAPVSIAPTSKLDELLVVFAFLSFASVAITALLCLLGVNGELWAKLKLKKLQKEAGRTENNTPE